MQGNPFSSRSFFIVHVLPKVTIEIPMKVTVLAMDTVDRVIARGYACKNQGQDIMLGEKQIIGITLWNNADDPCPPGGAFDPCDSHGNCPSDYQCQNRCCTCQTACTGDGGCPAPLNCAGNGCCIHGGLQPGQSCTENSKCASGHCVDDVCCNTACGGNCDRCNLSGFEGTCKLVDDACTGNCDKCGLSGNCEADSTHCSGDCVLCTGGGNAFDCTANEDGCSPCMDCAGSGKSFNCTAVLDGTGDMVGANTCDSSTTFCCGGSCVDVGAEYGSGCGTGECSGGTWGCNGTTQHCSSHGKPCDHCVAGSDKWRDAACTSAHGTACNTVSEQDCDACTSCKDAGSTVSCVATGGTFSYPRHTDDTLNSNQCTGTSTCNGSGSCKKKNGQGCASGAECASDHCVKGTCCNNEF